MPDPPLRTYTEDEAHAIFERAAKQQEAVRQADERARSGLTLAELQSVGADAGIDPAHIATAARALADAPGGPPGTFLGVPERLQATRTLPAPIGDASWLALVDALRLSFGTEGRAEQVGPRRTWTYTDQVLSSQVTVRAEGDTVAVEEPLRPQHNYAGAAVFAGVFLFLLAGTFEAGLLVLFAALTLIAVSLVRFGTPAWARVQERRFREAVDHVELSMLRALSDLDATPLADAASDASGQADAQTDPVTEARIDPSLFDAGRSPEAGDRYGERRRQRG
ncbi:MAG: hypothetical protein AAGK21_00260 [Bacteroidota bacterium]